MAAKEAAMKHCAHYDEEAVFINGFASGAEWCINSAWHDGAASCEARRKALVLFDNGSAKVYEDLRELSVERLWGYVDRFAYIDDLLPDGGKEVRNERGGQDLR